MSTPTPTPTIGGLSVAWIAMIGGMLREEGRAFRAAAEGPWIEVQNLSTGRFEPLTLENQTRGKVAFSTIFDRDEALRAIERFSRMPILSEEADSFFTPEERARARAALNTLSAIRHVSP